MNPAIQQWLMQGLRAALTTGDDSAARFDEAFWLASTSRKYFPWGEHGPPRDIVHVVNALDRLQSAASNGETIPARSLATVCRILGLVVSSLPYSEGVGHGPPLEYPSQRVVNTHQENEEYFLGLPGSSPSPRRFR